MTSASFILVRAGWTGLLGDRIQQPVHEPALGLVVKGVGDVDIFGDDRADRHVGAGEQLIGAGAKDRAHRPVEPFERPPLRQPGADQRVDLLAAGVRAADDIVEEVALGGVIMLVLDHRAEPMVVEFLEQARDGRLLHLLLIDRLDGSEARRGS